ncbi:MAG: hypothetical protein WAN46_07405, partial [Gammaproteobacteria bacterium]
LPPEVSSLFEMAFGNGGKQHGRPVSDEWVRGFERLKKSLTVCGRDRGHRYPQGASYCPWCELERRGMSRIFPGAGGASGGTPGTTAPPFSPPPVPPAQAYVAAPRAPAGNTISMVRKRDEGRRAVERWWQKIEAIPLPKVTGLPAVPKTNPKPPPMPQKFVRSALPSWMAGSIITVLCVMSLLLGIPARESMGLWAVGGVFVTTGGTSWLLLLLSHDGYREEWRKWRRRLKNAERRLKWSRKQWNGLAANQTVSEKKEELRRLYRKYQQGKAAVPAGYATAEEIRDLEELVNRFRKGEQSLQVMARHFEAVRKRVATEYVRAATEVKQATACLRRLSTISP